MPNKAKPLPTKEYLCRRLSYDGDSGELTWRLRPMADFGSIRIARSWNSKHAGKPAFTARTVNGYATGRIDDHLYLAHRVIWKMVHGVEPVEPDHIDGDRTNNRIANLKDGTRSLNMHNARRRRNNTSGIGNVQKRQGRWAVRFYGREYGTFANLEQAVALREQLAPVLGFSDRHGK